MANSFTSVERFLPYWESFSTKQRILFFSLDLVVILFAILVANALLECTPGPPPIPPLRVLICLPTFLWTIPVFLNSAIIVFQATGGVQIEKLQGGAIAHIVHLAPYCAFLLNSEGDALVGPGMCNICFMLGMTLVGFVLQGIWFHRQRGRLVIRQEQGHAGHFSEPAEDQCICAYSELVLSPVAMHQLSLSSTDKLVNCAFYQLPRLPHNTKIVNCSDGPVPLRRIPNDIYRY